MNTIKKVSWVLSIAIIAIAFAGCSQSPSVDDGEKIFHDDFDFKANGNVKLVSFTKSNGQAGEIKNQEGMTVESYSMEYSAEVEAIQRCVLSLDKFGLIYTWGETNDADAFNLYSNLQPGQIGEGFDGRDVMKMNLGQRCIIEGKIIFEKTEKGWSYRESKADHLLPDVLQ